MDGDARGIGEGIEGSRRGSLILSRGSSPARGVRRRPASCSDGVGGTETRPGRESGLARVGRRPAGPRPSGEGGSFPLFLFLFLSGICFLFSFYLFIFFSVLFLLKVFRYFIKMCFLHHNYQCII